MILHADGAFPSVNDDDVATCIADVPPSHGIYSDLDAL